MTHLSDYSFLQRAVANGWFYIWFVGYVFMYDRFSALHIKRILRFELRSIVTLLLLIAIPLHLIYDVGCAVIKYEEGFWANPNSGQIMGRPSFLWTQPNQDRASVLDYILACAMALLTSIFFLLQSFYHYISKSVTKSSFMSSFEFKLNIVCSMIVLAVFPLIQFIFRNNHAYRESAPQMAFSIVLLIIAVLGLRTHFRFKSLLKVALLTISEAAQGVAEKLEYFKDMNLILTGAMLGTGLSLGVASADGLMPNPVIARNKFASDLLVTQLNFFEFIIWVTLVLIFYPRRSVVGNTFGVSSGGGSLSRTAPASSRFKNNNQGDYVKSTHDFSHHQNSSNQQASNSAGRSSGPSKDRPSSLVPYRAPEGPNFERNVSGRHHNGSFNDNDTYPLTQSLAQDTTDVVQINAFKSEYDDPLQSIASVSSPTSPRYKLQFQHLQQSNSSMSSQHSMQSPPQSPSSPSSRRGGAASPSPFDPPHHIREGAGAGARPVFGAAVPRQPIAATSTTRVGQQTFVLEDAPRASHQLAKLSMQQQQAMMMDDYRQPSPSTPPRPGKDYRGFSE